MIPFRTPLHSSIWCTFLGIFVAIPESNFLFSSTCYLVWFIWIWLSCLFDAIDNLLNGMILRTVCRCNSGISELVRILWSVLLRLSRSMIHYWFLPWSKFEIEKGVVFMFVLDWKILWSEAVTLSIKLIRRMREKVIRDYCGCNVVDKNVVYAIIEMPWW